MVELIAATAKQEDIDLFRRFDAMKRWNEVDHIGFETFVAPDGLHPLVAPLVLIVTFYGFIEALARRRGLNPDTPPHLRKVTETV